MSSAMWRDEPDASYAKRSDKILWRAAEDCVVLFHEDDGRAFALSRSASAAWRLMDGSRSIGEVARELSGGSSGDDGAVLEDVLTLVAQFESQGCVVVKDAPNESQTPREPVDLDAWQSPKVEEIVFGACDCSSSGRGVMRNAECVPKDVKVVMSTT